MKATKAETIKKRKKDEVAEIKRRAEAAAAVGEDDIKEGIGKATQKLPQQTVEIMTANVIEALDGLDKEEEHEESREEEEAVNSVTFDVVDKEEEEQDVVKSTEDKKRGKKGEEKKDLKRMKVVIGGDEGDLEDKADVVKQNEQATQLDE